MLRGRRRIERRRRRRRWCIRSCAAEYTRIRLGLVAGLATSCVWHAASAHGSSRWFILLWTSWVGRCMVLLPYLWGRVRSIPLYDKAGWPGLNASFHKGQKRASVLLLRKWAERHMTKVKRMSGKLSFYLRAKLVEWLTRRLMEWVDRGSIHGPSICASLCFVPSSTPHGPHLLQYIIHVYDMSYNFYTSRYI